MRKFTLLPFLLALISNAALAQQTDELDALRLADSAAKPVASASDWHSFTEAAFGQSVARASGAALSNQRLSIDIAFDKTFSPGWRAVLSDRLDLQRQQQPLSQPLSQPTRHSEINTLKEAYLSWQRQPDQLLDLGRVNTFHGVASGYNPTDFFRSGAVRSMVSVDPASLKKNRMGSVMLRGQKFWDSGSVSALFSPKLAQQANAASFSADLGATNNQDRYLLALSQKISDSITPQWLLYGQRHQSPQLGLNLSTLLNHATVAYLEYAGGRSRSLLSQALHGQDDSAWRNRLATGLTYTSSDKLSLSVEYEYHGDALDKTGWDALRHGTPQAYGRYRAWQQNQQELPTRQELFLYANWQDAGFLHLDLAAMQKINLADHSRLTWLEARYHLEQTDLALQWQKNSGEASSAYGAATQKSAWQAVLRYYF